MHLPELDNIARLESRFWWYRGMNRMVAGLLDRYLTGTPTSILDAGCGTGSFARVLEDRYRAKVHATDIAMRGLHHARRLGLSSLTLADIRALPFRSDTFDLAVSLDVLVHLPRGAERPALAELVRTLRPGGLLALRLAAFDALRSRHSEFISEQQRFTRPRLLQLVRNAGLEPIFATYANSLLSPVAFLRFRLWEPLFAARSASGVQPIHPVLNSLLESILDLEACWLRRGRALPIGQSILLIARKPNHA